MALPLARPGIVVATILAFIFSWNNFVFGAVLAGRATRTLPAAVYNVLTFEQLAWGPLAAAAIVVTLPVLLLTIVIQKEIVVGLTHGGVKGGLKRHAQRHPSALERRPAARAGRDGPWRRAGPRRRQFSGGERGRRVIELAGASSPEALDAILTLFPLDTFVVRLR